MDRVAKQLDQAGLLLDELFVLMRTVHTYGTDHPQSKTSASRFAEQVAASEMPFALQFIGGGAFLDQTLIPLTIERFQRLWALAAALDNLDKHELVFEELPAPESLIRLGQILARGSQGRSDEMETTTLENIRWRSIPRATWGVEGEEVDEEKFARIQVALAIEDAEQIDDEDPHIWNWTRGFNVIRRLEHAIQVSGTSTAHALETAAGPWSPSRRAVSATMHILWAMHDCGIKKILCRTAAHTTFALAKQGYQSKMGLDLSASAGPLFERMVNSPFRKRTGIDPHRLRVCAIVYQFKENLAEIEKEVQLTMKLIELVYELERQRCPVGTDYALSKLDLLAKVIENKSRFGEKALRLFMHVTGVLPPGTRIELADGKKGTVVGPGPSNNPWHPQVQVGDRVFVPLDRVTIDTGFES